jgi:hypothetical protein
MDEGTTRAIPLRRPRGRALTMRPQHWASSLTTGVTEVLRPPHQLWLAGLGATALLLRSARDAWWRLIVEGGRVEDWLLDAIGNRSGPRASA